MIEIGLVDAAVVGGVDSLCMTTLYGFKTLELVSSDICRPWDAQRSGLSIGEAAAFALVEREPEQVAAWLLGVGESSDAHHMSSPHPEGAGATAAMRGALAMGSLIRRSVAGSSGWQSDSRLSIIGTPARVGATMRVGPCRWLP
jgi:3-oxoacyl-[acyl-carrier-protein] synthase-1